MSIEKDSKLVDVLSPWIIDGHRHVVTLIDQFPISIRYKESLLAFNAWVNNPETAAEDLCLSEGRLLDHLDFVWNNTELHSLWNELEKARGFGQDDPDD